MVLEFRTHPDKGRGWFENLRFWRTSFVDGPLARRGTKLTPKFSVESSLYTIPNCRIFSCVFGKHRSLELRKCQRSLLNKY